MVPRIGCYSNLFCLVPFSVNSWNKALPFHVDLPCKVHEWTHNQEMYFIFALFPNYQSMGPSHCQYCKNSIFSDVPPCRKINYWLQGAEEWGWSDFKVTKPLWVLDAFHTLELISPNPRGREKLLTSAKSRDQQTLMDVTPSQNLRYGFYPPHPETDSVGGNLLKDYW